MRNNPTDGGFTMVELAVVVLIIGVLVAIAIPVFVEARANAARKACYSNERAAEAAYNEYLSSEQTVTVIADWQQLMAVTIPSRLATEPKCPSGPRYTFSNGTVDCVVHGSYRDSN